MTIESLLLGLATTNAQVHTATAWATKLKQESQVHLGYTACGALAAAKTQATEQIQNVYNPAGAYVGTDPDANICFKLNRDRTRGALNAWKS